MKFWSKINKTTKLTTLQGHSSLLLLRRALTTVTLFLSVHRDSLPTSAMHSQCCSMPRFQQQEVRPWPLSLSSSLHNVLHRLDVTECIQYKPGITMHRWLQDKTRPRRIWSNTVQTCVWTCVKTCRPAASLISPSTPFSYTMLLVKYFWSSGLLCCWLECEELSAGQSPWSCT